MDFHKTANSKNICYIMQLCATRMQQSLTEEAAAAPCIQFRSVYFDGTNLRQIFQSTLQKNKLIKTEICQFDVTQHVPAVLRMRWPRLPVPGCLLICLGSNGHRDSVHLTQTIQRGFLFGMTSRSVDVFDPYCSGL